MSWLKKIGQALNLANKYLGIFGPVIGSTSPKAGEVVTVIDQGLDNALAVVIAVEAAGQAIGTPGADKARMTVPALAQVFLASQALRGKKVRDEAAFKDAMQRLGGAIADGINALED